MHIRRVGSWICFIGEIIPCVLEAALLYHNTFEKAPKLTFGAECYYERLHSTL